MTAPPTPAPAERCDGCDRTDCPLPAARASMRDTIGAPASVARSAAVEMQNARMHCDLRLVNWRARCLEAEALLRDVLAEPNDFEISLDALTDRIRAHLEKTP
jgi:hypothetical protein